MFEPLGSSDLYAPTQGSVQFWWDKDYDQTQWTVVNPTDQLRNTIYEFRPNNNALVSLTKICRRRTRSITTRLSADQGSAFRNALDQRDIDCIICHQQRQASLISSHLIPRRLGDNGVSSVIERFVGSDALPLDRYDHRIGALIHVSLDVIVGVFEASFWNNGQTNQYTLHCFIDSEPGAEYNIVGAEQPVTSSNPDFPPLHGYPLTLTSHNTQYALPPPGVFAWHYLQCVLKKFATKQYEDVPNIAHYEVPFRTASDEDDDDWDFFDERHLKNPPYPSYLWDLAYAKEDERLEEEERKDAIRVWSDDVSKAT